MITIRKGDEFVLVNESDKDLREQYAASGWVEDGVAPVPTDPPAASGAPTRILDPRQKPTVMIEMGDSQLVINKEDLPKWAAEGWMLVGDYVPPADSAASREKTPPGPPPRSRPTVQLWLNGDFVVVNDTDEDKAPWLEQGYGPDPGTLSPLAQAEMQRALEEAARKKAEAEAKAAEEAAAKAEAEAKAASEAEAKKSSKSK